MAKPFYRYTDGAGEVHIVDHLDKVPLSRRATAERLSIQNDAVQAVPLGTGPAVSVSGGQAFVEQLHGPSVAVGIAFTFIGYAAILVFRRRGAAMVKVSLVGAALVLVGGAYLGWVQRQAGFAPPTFATPGQLVDQARRSVSLLKDRLREQQRVLQSLEEHSRE